MIITALISVMSIAVFYQRTAPRLYASAIFVLITLLHELFLSDLDGFAYYGSAALFDFFIIALTSGISPTPKTVIELHAICAASIVINFIGWALWVSYMPPDAYNTLFIVLYAWAVFILLQRDGADDVGGFTVDSWRSCFRFNRHAIIINNCRNEG